MTRYFYTKDTPHEWSSGPNLIFWNDKGEYISSMEEAAQLAMAARKGKWGVAGFTKTTYGAMHETPELE